MAQPADGTQAGVRDGQLWLVDGFNVVQVSLLRGRPREQWWSAGRRAELLGLAEGFQGGADRLCIVFDGPRPPQPVSLGSDSALQVVFSPSADEWMLTRLTEAPDPAQVVVVTADRKLAARARHRGATVVSPRAFLARCREAGAETT
jgi:predicted RNA-binding protein with PIN domain